jgi:two-component system LytT family response regulator
MITAVLIDDDENLRDGMKGLLALYAPEIKIIGKPKMYRPARPLLKNCARK